ncbi:unnamed protein product [Miscanthus lutarioriparius]|uniref:F-box domain-containing protein n=1 Tax=Miscanthus lutarioriparius TaxID=422564 RepID=A0A811S115_9POAL|nr:unnamed protein product [Miscanthus lutarioriparius]
MEMRTHHPSKRGSMDEEDRLSSLPDDLLHSILRELPLKHAVRTSALSRRWALQWLRALASSRVLDFTDLDLAAAATVRRCLELHAEHAAPLDVFRLALRSPPAGSSDGAFGRDVVGWIASAVARGAREVEVDLHLTPTPTPTPTGSGRRRRQRRQVPDSDDGSAAFVELPGGLFQARNSLARLALGGLSLRAVPLAAPGLAGLRSLSLSRIGVTDEVVRGILASCRALESLSLRSCSLLASVSIACERLRELQLLGCRAVQEVSIACERLRELRLLGCRAVQKLQVAAPALESLTLYGQVCWSENGGNHLEPFPVFFYFVGMPALRDAYLSHLGCGAYNVVHDMSYPHLYDVVAHARIVTLCSIGLLLLYNHSMDDIAYREMPNLEELQLLLAEYSDDEDQMHVSTFFMLTPLPVLQRLFLHLPSDLGYGWSRDWDSDDEAQLPSDLGYGWNRDWDSDDEADSADLRIEHEIVLDQLTLIKVFNFMATRRELRLLTFFLTRAPSLEQLVLVTAEGEKAPADDQLKAMQERVSELQRSSREARISVCRPKEDDSQNHAHTRFFHEDDEYVKIYDFL